MTVPSLTREMYVAFSGGVWGRLWIVWMRTALEIGPLGSGLRPAVVAPQSERRKGKRLAIGQVFEERSSF